MVNLPGNWIVPHSRRPYWLYPCTLWEENPTFENFCENLQQLRYREGTIGDYTDRLHYMTDWFYENERKGIVKDMGREIGGASLPLDYLLSLRIRIAISN